jgi:NodT family efflux transporter outer membrane factor (OMF) lipoprotein
MYILGSDKSGGRKTAAPLPLIALLSVIISICACTVGPKYARPLVSTPTTYKELPLRNAPADTWQPARPDDGALRGKWWEVFNDPELSALEERANSSNQDIAAAAANFLAARAMVREARSQYFPTVSASPSIMNARPSTGQFGGLQSASSSSATFSVKSYMDYSLPFDASWEPDLWGRVRNQVRANVFAAQASAADLQNVRLSEQAELAVDYYELRAQDSLKELFDSTVAAYQDSVSLNANLYRSGLGNDEAVAQAEAQLKAAQAQETNLGVLRAQYEHAIAVLTGQPASDFSLPFVPLQALPPPIPLGIPSDLLQRRPDIAAAERSVAQANSQIGVADAAYYPNIALTASGGWGSSSASDWFTWPSRFWSVGPSLTETIFDGGLRRATVAQYRAAYDATVATYRGTVLTAFQQVEDNLASLRLLSEDIQQQNDAIQASSRSLSEANVRYQAGLDPYLNVISAQTVLLANRETIINFQSQEMVASIQLIKALGGGWDTSQLPKP